MDPLIIVVIVLAAVAAVLTAVVILLGKKINDLKRRMGGDFAADTRVRGGVRYTEDEAVMRDGEVNVSLARKDVVLSPGNPVTVQKGGKLMPGVYTVLCSAESESTCKLRAGGFVRTYSHGEKIALAEGDEVSAVNMPVILR